MCISEILETVLKDIVHSLNMSLADPVSVVQYVQNKFDLVTL